MTGAGTLPYLASISARNGGRERASLDTCKLAGLPVFFLIPSPCSHHTGLLAALH